MGRIPVQARHHTNPAVPKEERRGNIEVSALVCIRESPRKELKLSFISAPSGYRSDPTALSSLLVICTRPNCTNVWMKRKGMSRRGWTFLAYAGKEGP